MGSRSRRVRRPVLLAAICAAVTTLLCGLHYLGLGALLKAEFFTIDRRIQLGRKAQHHPQIAYLAIDQRSVLLDQFPEEEIQASPALAKMREGWPWPRDVYPLIIDRLLGAGARAVGFDLMFPTPKEGDELFHEALKRYADKVVIGAHFQLGSEGAVAQQFFPPARTLVPSGSSLDRVVGFVNFWVDEDEVVRNANYHATLEEVSHEVPTADSQVFDSLAARLAAQAGFAEKVPEGSAPRMMRWVEFANDHLFPPISVSDIFDSNNWKHRYKDGAFFKNKIVLVGPLGDWAKDVILTPFGPLPGPEVHLNALNAVLTGEFLSEMGQGAQWLLIIGAGAAAYLVCLLTTRPIRRFFVFVVASFGFVAANQFIYDSTGLLVLTVMPLVVFNANGLTCLVWEFVREQVERARTRRTLERYVSKNVVHEILDNPATYFNTLGGVRKPVAVLFTDLRGFTTLTEEADSQALVSQLNEFFSEMVGHIFRNSGTLDKFMGDAIMAVWGNVQSDGQAADVANAVKTALSMRESLCRLNEDWRKREMPTLAMGIGISHGEAIVGNMGSEEKMELTVIGDVVNLGSRLEGLTKEYGLELLLSEGAAAQVAETYHLQLVDNVRVKGKTRPVDVFTVLGPKSKSLAEDICHYLQHYLAGIEAYRAGRFEEARSAFERGMEFVPDDKLAHIYFRRCEELIAVPPGDSWDGVFTMTKK